MNPPVIRRGQIWLVDWFVITLSTKGLPVATHIPIEPDASNGLREKSWVKCEQVLTISKQRLHQQWGQLSAAAMSQVESAVKTALDM